ncbi:hypothetical protein Sme01_05180 [Sphaerisporangium melleum]|uniref:Uncharacterized protein n=1 Tax=Sphaerisporangium melleum TaxID=321316 RepID=A0A917QR62_9ACTN|nr:hypothetical protein GCM10007964_02750 [Sphaerisporangium melleum]GII68042.1 hypothetical protein Sme01_05180 [Sphaerisporangium melleum]
MATAISPAAAVTDVRWAVTSADASPIKPVVQDTDTSPSTPAKRAFLRANMMTSKKSEK